MAEPVTIDDDDVVMVDDLQVLQLKEPFVIDDEDDDKINKDKTVSTQNVSTEETIVIDDDAPTTTVKQKPTKVRDNKIEKSFVTNLENNRLMDKIVTRVTTMENATGMHRVVQKTLLPLYRDANNRFKESDEFRTMLKKTYKLLMKDPDHKFLHIKTLCEELKSGGLRRKVPFVTLATNTKKDGFETDYRDLTSSSKEMDRNKNNNVEITPIPEINRKNYITQKKSGKVKKRGAKKKKFTPTRAPIETRSCVIVPQTEKTDVIELDDSDTESQGEVEDDPKNDVIFIDETHQKNDIPNTLLKESLEVPQEFDKVLKVKLEDCNKENQAIQKDSHNENNMIQENQTTQKESHNENKLAQENQVTQKDFHNENNMVQDIEVIQRDSHNENRMVQPTLAENIYKNNIVTKSTLEKDSDKQNLLTNIQTTFPIDLNKSNTLLVPTMGNDYTKVPTTAENINVPPIVSHIYDRQGKLIGVEVESEVSKRYKTPQPLITNYAENGNPVITGAFSYKENTEPLATNSNALNKVLLESELSKQYNRTQPIIKYYATNGNPVMIEAFSFEENTEPQTTNTNTLNSVLLESELRKLYKITHTTITNTAENGNPVITGAFSYKENTEPQATDTNTLNKVLLESELIKQYKRTLPIITNTAENGNPVITGAFSYKENTEPQATDTNTQNKVLQDTEDIAKNGRSSKKETDYDLLIPQTCLALVPNKPVKTNPEVVLKPVTVVPGHITVGSGPVTVGHRPVVVPAPVTVVYEPVMEVCKPVKEGEQDNRTQNEIAQLETRIADLKKCVDILEETEVTCESYGSAYYICSKYKEDIVQCYKRICQLKGDSQPLRKKRQIRLQVTEGHPAGPARRLEDLLNRSIDSTGEVPFPSFPEVLKCVVNSDLCDNLRWDRHTILQEAIALFRQCGQALRKRRQQREYKDLLSLIRNKKHTNDPAEKDPILLAKLEENKRIALKKEEEILDRYVAMEQNPNMSAEKLYSDKNYSDSDSDEEIEQNIPSAGESSRNTFDNFSILPNKVNAPPISTSNSKEAPSPNTDNIVVSNLVITPTVVTAPESSNPILMTYLLNSPAPPQKLKNYMKENPPSMRDRLIMDDESNEDSDIMSESEESDFSEKEEKFNIETEITVMDTTVGFNNETNKKDDLTSGGISNIENKNLTTYKQPCNINDSADGVKQNCDSSISMEGASVKTEDRVKTEPVDVQNIFDELGDDFECQVFDIEDPFLVIEISSDESSDDEEL